MFMCLLPLMDLNVIPIFFLTVPVNKIVSSSISNDKKNLHNWQLVSVGAVTMQQTQC